MSAAHHFASQAQYQVRFDWGRAGADAISDGVHAFVWVDQLGESSVDLPQGLVVAGGIENRVAVAQWVLDQQAATGDRFRIAVIAAGERRDDGSLRFAVEDLLGAGAVIDALASVGIDACSPEAASAASAWQGLRNAASHLVAASASGKAAGMHAKPFAATSVVPVLREG